MCPPRFAKLIGGYIGRLLNRSYECALEEEVARLRAENRGLVNSILGLAGIPPMRVLEVRGLRLEVRKGQANEIPVGKTQGSWFGARIQGRPHRNQINTGAHATPSSSKMRFARQPPTLNEGEESVACRERGLRRGTRHLATGTQFVAKEENSTRPLRRRSWQQIGRALEVEDARAARRERESDTETFPAPRNVVPRV